MYIQITHPPSPVYMFIAGPKLINEVQCSAVYCCVTTAAVSCCQRSLPVTGTSFVLDYSKGVPLKWNGQFYRRDATRSLANLTPPHWARVFGSPPVGHDWGIKCLGMSSRVCTTWHIKCPFYQSFIHQVIIITGLNKLYDRPVASLPGGGVRWRPKRGPSRVGWCVCVWGGGRVLL